MLLGASTASKIYAPMEGKRAVNSLRIYTEDGSMGQTGRVTEPIAGLIQDLNIAVIYSCGPMAMLSAIDEITRGTDVVHQCAVEESMACGAGPRRVRTDGHRDAHDPRAAAAEVRAARVRDRDGDRLVRPSRARSREGRSVCRWQDHRQHRLAGIGLSGGVRHRLDQRTDRADPRGAAHRVRTARSRALCGLAADRRAAGVR